MLVEPPRPHVVYVTCKSMLVRLIADSKIISMRSLLDCQEKRVPQQNLPRRIPGHIDCEARYLAYKAAPITESVFKRDRHSVPIRAHKSSPSGGGGHIRQPLD